ncbi:6-carboxytetrahydropterin synthase QueD [Paenibacillus yanchengensis]|uniref:6-carboxy-5,6,7,8-tetrahydropterin synthase n=1 Tax=Paenibacillus yanchengensis TaxID=2035833 RepID=A0ABW4YNU4_9BACL
MLQQIYAIPPHPYTYELNKDFHFSAAHYIPHQEAGKCQQVHGHTYFVNVTIGGNELDASGFLINFTFLKKLIHEQFDHQMLNDQTKYFNNIDAAYFPTTEVVARTIYDIVQAHLDTLHHRPQCLQIYLRETPSSYCIYRPKKLLNWQQEEQV